MAVDAAHAPVPPGQLQITIPTVRNKLNSDPVAGRATVSTLAANGNEIEVAAIPLGINWLCNDSCAACEHNRSNCVTCAASFYSQDGRCIRKCDVGYVASGSSCRPCSPYCRLCDFSRCLACHEEFALSPEGHCQIIEKHRDILVARHRFPYLSAYCAAVLLYASAKKWLCCRKQLSVWLTVFIFWSGAELVVGVAVMCTLVISRAYLASGVILGSILVYLMIQKLACLRLKKNLEMNSEWGSIRGKYISVRFFNALAYYWNYKFFLIFWSNISAAKEAYAHDFLNKLSLMRILYHRLWNSLFLHLLELLTLVVYAATTCRGTKPLQMRELFVIESSVYHFCLLALTLLHARMVNAAKRSLSRNHD